MNKSNTLSNIWDSACFVEEDGGMDWWDRWTVEDEAHALWVAECDADAYEVNAMREAEAEEESQARIEELVAEWNSAMAMREEEPEAEAEPEAEEWLWADEGKWLQAQAKALMEMVLE
jgi:hypothetical protein